MITAPRLYLRVGLVAITLLITAVGIRAQSGMSTASGVVADATATRQGKFVAISGAKVELEQDIKERPRKFTATSDNSGEYSFGEIPYGHYLLKVSAPGYRNYELKFFVDSDGSAYIAVLLSKQAK
jgi:hypothetical protein